MTNPGEEKRAERQGSQGKNRRNMSLTDETFIRMCAVCLIVLENNDNNNIINNNKDLDV